MTSGWSRSFSALTTRLAPAPLRILASGRELAPGIHCPAQRRDAIGRQDDLDLIAPEPRIPVETVLDARTYVRGRPCDGNVIDDLNDPRYALGVCDDVEALEARCEHPSERDLPRRR